MMFSKMFYNVQISGIQSSETLIQFLRCLLFIQWLQVFVKKGSFCFYI